MFESGDIWYGQARARVEDEEFVRIGFRTYPRWANGYEIRDRESYPYSYSFFISKGPIKNFSGDDISGAYDDRMRGWDHDAWIAAWDAMPAKRYRDLSMEDLSKFLTVYFKRKVTCLQLLEGCNVSNGYPIYYFVWREENEPSET